MNKNISSVNHKEGEDSKRMNQKNKGIVFVVLSFSMLFLSIAALSETSSWDCPKCGRKGNNGNYCGGCAYPSPWIEGGKEALQTVGNFVKFGHYEQDNNLDNGKEEIEWIVLDVQNGKSLLLSRYLLDTKPYNDQNTSEISWQRCSLREWLNEEFFKTAFSDEEQGVILTTWVENHLSERNIYTYTDDKLFLLSIEEVFCFFSTNESRKCALADYAIEQGASKINTVLKDGQMTGWWWLRSSISSKGYANCVRNDGELDEYEVRCTNNCIRPALWIEVGSGLK